MATAVLRHGSRGKDRLPLISSWPRLGESASCWPQQQVPDALHEDLQTLPRTSEVSASLSRPWRCVPFAASSLVQSRPLSTASRLDPDGEEEMPVVYEGPFSAALKSVKFLSVSTCLLSVGLSPIITFYTMPGVDVIAKGTLGALFVLASASTTGALHWLSSPYIHRMRWRKGSPQVQVQMLSWLATERTEHLKLADVRFPYTSRPLASFAVNGKVYYVEHSLVQSEELLKRLQP